MPGSLVIIGASTRAAAQSAIRAGYQPWCIDLFGDRDLQAIAPVHVCPAADYPAGILRLLQDAPVDAPALLTGALENYPDIVEGIGFEHKLLGSSADAIRRVRKPLALPSLPATAGLKFCKTRTASYFAHRLSHLVFGVWGRTKYLIKPCNSAGGIGIEWWHPGKRIGREHYIQQYVRGTPHSAVFLSDGWSASLLGVTEQLVGEIDLGAGEFRYCGSIGPVQLTSRARAALSHMGVQLTQRYDLRGVFGVDFVMDWRGNLWPVEVNPRYVSSVEIVERAYHVSALSTGAAAVARQHKGHPLRYHGKAVIFARKDVKVGDLYDALPREQIADVPQIGTPVQAGQPICTVFGSGHNRDTCYAELRQRARTIYAFLEQAAHANA